MLAVIGGTGLYQLAGLEVQGTRELTTPFGAPSAPVTLGRFAGKKLLFMPRHGAGHALLPNEINYRANLWALKACGARAVISLSASGSLQESVRPGELALVSQYFDWTRGRRATTFFGEGLVAHVTSAQASCPLLREAIASAARAAGISLHTGLTYAAVEGPRLGTRAESLFLKSAGCDLVGMTNVPEAFLAYEAQLAYATIAIVTDYDCWQDDPAKHASTAEILALYKNNLDRIHRLLAAVFSRELDVAASPSRRSLAGAVVTPESALSAEKRELLRFLRE